MTAVLELPTGTPDLDAIEAKYQALAPADRRRIDEALAGVGTLTFREFVSRVNPRFVWYAHCVRLAAVLQRVADGELTRVIIQAPPRHGKSELLSRLFSAYYLYRHPDRWVGLTSYAAELANTLSRNARANYQAIGRGVAGDAGAVKHWETGAGGGLWAAGFGGPITGKGAHLGLIDDPIKNAEEASSHVIAERNKDWYRSTFYTRLEPGGAIVVMQTRWPGPADLIGWLLEEESGEEPERWHIVSFEAEKQEDPPAIPASCTLEPDPRAPGEALCPERYPLPRLRKIASTIGEFFYSALFGQRPRPRSGKMFPRELATIVDAAPAGIRWMRAWDKAGTEGGGKYTAGVKLGIHDGIVYVADAVREQRAAQRRRQLMRQTAELDGTGTTIHIEQEPGSSGKDSAQDDITNLVGFVVTAEPSTGNKEIRAEPLAAQWQAGNVRLLRGAWNKPFLDELESFPDGAFKDQTDAAALAFNKLARPQGWGARSLSD